MYLLSLFLSPPGPPDRPVIMQLQADTTSLYLSWEKPVDNNAPILRYHITLQVVEDERRNTFRTNTNDHELYVHGLTPFTVYSVQVVAVNSIGVSAPSVPMIVMTAEGSECVCLFVHTCSIHDLLLCARIICHW